jgi:hypothetical protein
MGQREVQLHVSVSDTRGNSVHSQRACAHHRVAISASEARPTGEVISKTKANTKETHTIQVCCRREIVDESNAARMERDVAKLFNIMQRCHTESKQI